MKTFRTELILFIDDYEASDPMDANRIVNEYLDVLADIAPASLTWSSCDWKIEEVK